MINPAGRAAIPPAASTPPPPPPPASGARRNQVDLVIVDELPAADRATVRLRCLDIATRIHVARYADLGLGPDATDTDLRIAQARRLEAYVLGQPTAASAAPEVRCWRRPNSEIDPDCPKHGTR